MHLQNLKIQNFKNHADLTLFFENPIIRFSGPNGAGKTNILDALHYLCMTKSYFNHSSDAQSLRYGSSYFSIEGTFKSNLADASEMAEKITCIYNTKTENTSSQEKIGKKNIQKNGKKYASFAEHIGQFPIVIISPEDHILIHDGSQERRRFLDMTLVQCDAHYVNQLQNYKKLLQERNILLKKWAYLPTGDRDYLEIIDAQMGHYGAKIFEARKNFVANFMPYFTKYHSAIAEGCESAHLSFASDQWEETLSILLSKNRETDIQKQYSSKGIHRDDLIFDMDGKPLRKVGSQGQQKSFLIALKLAQYDFLYTQKKRAPLLLLDDIFDKLDENRLAKVMEVLPKQAKGQIFITHTANLNNYFSAQDAQNFYLPDLICEKNTLIYP